MSAVIYWLAVRLYAVAIQIASFFNAKAKLFVKGRQQLLPRIKYALIDERRPRIWMHCASLGEFEQGRPLLEKLRQQYSNHAFVLTFFSPSGYEVRKDYDGADYVFYLPVDSIYNSRKFLDIVSPALCIFVKYEHWYFYLSRIAAKGIPCLLVSAIFRKQLPFFKWYGGLYRRMLQYFNHIFVQDDNSQLLLQKIGVDHVSVVGDTRFDRVTAGRALPDSLPRIAAFAKGKKLFVAGSTWPEDEKLLHQVLDKLPDGWKMVIVPHNVDSGHIEQIIAMHGAVAVKWSNYSEQTEKRLLVVDTIGLLLKIYSYAHVAWVGGGMTKNGVHNVLEPAVYGIPVLHGPVYEQYLEARELILAGGSIVMETPMAILHQLSAWDQDTFTYEQTCRAAKSYVLSKTGATERILKYIDRQNLLK